MKNILRHPAVKVVVFILCLVPFLLLAYRWNTNHLGINRIETVARYTGDWTLRFLLIALCITPLRRLTGWNDLIRFRRMVGLFAFFYGCLHLTHYIVLDKQFFWPEIQEDLLIRRFFIMGWLGFLLMLPLAATSTTWAIRKMGGKRWQLLHRAAYLSPAAGILHFHWQGKAALPDPFIYAGILAVLLGYRAITALRK